MSSSAAALTSAAAPASASGIPLSSAAASSLAVVGSKVIASTPAVSSTAAIPSAVSTLASEVVTTAAISVASAQLSPVLVTSAAAMPSPSSVAPVVSSSPAAVSPSAGPRIQTSISFAPASSSVSVRHAVQSLATTPAPPATAAAATTESKAVTTAAVTSSLITSAAAPSTSQRAVESPAPVPPSSTAVHSETKANAITSSVASVAQKTTAAPQAQSTAPAAPASQAQNTATAQKAQSTITQATTAVAAPSAASSAAVNGGLIGTSSPAQGTTQQAATSSAAAESKSSAPAEPASTGSGHAQAAATTGAHPTAAADETTAPQAQTTLSKPIVTTVTDAEGRLTTSTPAFITSIHASTVHGGAVSSVTVVESNPTFLPQNQSTLKSNSFFANKPLVGGVFTLIALAIIGLFVGLCLLCRRRNGRAARSRARRRVISLPVPVPSHGPFGPDPTPRPSTTEQMQQTRPSAPSIRPLSFTGASAQLGQEQGSPFSDLHAYRPSVHGPIGMAITTDVAMDSTPQPVGARNPFADPGEDRVPPRRSMLFADAERVMRGSRESSPSRYTPSIPEEAEETDSIYRRETHRLPSLFPSHGPVPAALQTPPPQPDEMAPTIPLPVAIPRPPRAVLPPPTPKRSSMRKPPPSMALGELQLMTPPASHSGHSTTGLSSPTLSTPATPTGSDATRGLTPEYEVREMLAMADADGPPSPVSMSGPLGSLSSRYGSRKTLLDVKPRARPPNVQESEGSRDSQWTVVNL